MSITKLYAGVVGNPLNTTGPVLAESVNQLIEAHVANLKSLPAIPQTDVIYTVLGLIATTTTGGGHFVWSPTTNKTFHDGSSVIAPEAIAAWDGSAGNNTTVYLDWYRYWLLVTHRWYVCSFCFRYGRAYKSQ